LMEYPRATALTLITCQGKLLLLRMREEDIEYWAPPGGGLRQGETLPEAAAREAREEAGIDVSVGSLLYVHDFINPEDGCHKVEVYFRAVPVGDPAPRKTARQDARILEARWFSMESVRHLPLFPPEFTEMLPVDLAEGAAPEVRYF